MILNRNFANTKTERNEKIMMFTSTRNNNLSVSAAQAILQGLSKEGGLFVPQQFPQLSIETIYQMDYCQMAETVLGSFLTDYDPQFLQQAVKQVYGSAFGTKAGYVQQVNENTWSLELWHGPTCAFKDYALQMMPKLLVQARTMLGSIDTTVILVATSGDTGKAALEGYRDLEGIRIKVFYPTGGTSEIQRLQMATQQGNNVEVYAVEGNFDAAQTGVKKVFADQALGQLLKEKGVSLSSANSINWGRLVPQIVYYFYSYSQLVKQGVIALGNPVDFCVPTGNFGDILAGWYAKQMGLPVGKLICASNKNNVLSEFFATGVYNAKREFFKTTSPSMDILISSNLERLLYHVSGGNDTLVAELMDSLAKTGSYTLPKDLLEKIQQDFAAGWADDQQAADEIKHRWDTDGYLCDPHTAVAFRVAEQTTHTKDAPCVVLSTASPYKFPMAVLQALGCPVPQQDFEALRQLETFSGVQAPAQLKELEQKPQRFSKVILPSDIVKAATEEISAL